MASIVNAAHLSLMELEDDINMSLKASESSKQPSIRLLSSQPQVSWEMRPQLLEFLAQAQAALELMPDTLALAVSILDRYMSKRVVYARHYQLLGCVCLWLAAKTIDDKHKVPTSGTLTYLCADTYGESMFSQMELHVLSTLDWNVLAPTAPDFIDMSIAKTARMLGSDLFSAEDYSAVRSMSRYVCECALFPKETAAIKPSEVAASAVALSTIVLDALESRGWPPIFPESCSKECFDALVVLIANPPSECVARYAGVDQYSASSIFSQFFSLLSSSSSAANSYDYFRGQRIGAMGTYPPYYAEEPCTPIRSRQVSFDSYGAISPMGDDLATPQNTQSSPHTYFAPLTPDGAYCYSGSAMMNLPNQK